MTIANLAPELERRRDPEGVSDVLAWAGQPLATVEVAAVAQLEPEDAHEELARVADFQPVGNDGYWTLRAAEPAAGWPASPTISAGSSAAQVANASALARSAAGWGPVATAMQRTPSACAQAMSRGVSPITSVCARGCGRPLTAARARAIAGSSERSS